MVVLVDLDEEAPSPHVPRAPGLVGHVKAMHHSIAPRMAAEEAEHGSASSSTARERANPNMNGFSAALSCYPIVRQLAGQLDLNTLHDLSRTCRQFRANLLEYRDQLVRHTLQCCNEHAALGTTRQLTSGRVGRCARDMVGECQRCARVVCRNCTMKPPPTPALRARHRRLCRTCNKSPLPLLLLPSSSGSPSPPGSPLPQPSFFAGDTRTSRVFTSPAFERTPCSCDNVVWLCAPCGKDVRNADTMYVRGWSWRTRYSHYLGGVGTGAGEGNEGVECGRASACLAAKFVEQETCEQDVLDALAAADASPDAADRWRGSSYLAQEMEGIGGVLKVKHKKQVRVGECVKLYEDERDKAVQCLGREVAGQLRSWCSWCERVVLGEKDKADLAGMRPSSSGSSSTCSAKSSK